MERTIQFFWSNKAKNHKMHASLGCSGVFRQRVRLGSRFETAPLASEGQPDAALATYEYQNASCPTFATSEPLTIQEIADYPRRPCRLCALELVLDLAMQEGEPTEPITFSGQFMPEEIGLHKFEFEEASDSTRERMDRILSRMRSVERTTTSVGPVGFGLVTPLAKQILVNSLRSYEVPEIFSHLVRAENRSTAFARATFDLYWTLRSRRPPEVNSEHQEADLAETALSLAK